MELFEFLFGFVGDKAGFQHSAVRGLRLVVLLAHLAPNPCLLDQLHRRLEEVRIQPQHCIQLVESLKLVGCVVSTVANRASDNRVVLLFHETVVVFAVRPAAGKRDLVLRTVSIQVVVDELATVVHTE